MFIAYSDGFCPQCLLEGRDAAMHLNCQDLWECPHCHLQAAGGAGSFMILNERGNGNFKPGPTSATDYIVGAFINREREDDPMQSDGPFASESQFREFIKKIDSTPKEEF